MEKDHTKMCFDNMTVFVLFCKLLFIKIFKYKIIILFLFAFIFRKWTQITAKKVEIHLKAI